MPERPKILFEKLSKKNAPARAVDEPPARLSHEEIATSKEQLTHEAHHLFLQLDELAYHYELEHDATVIALRERLAALVTHHNLAPFVPPVRPPQLEIGGALNDEQKVFVAQTFNDIARHLTALETEWREYTATHADEETENTALETYRQKMRPQYTALIQLMRRKLPRDDPRFAEVDVRRMLVARDHEDFIAALTTELAALPDRPRDPHDSYEHGTDLATAEHIMGADFLGPDTAEATFGVKVSAAEIPPIPFSEAELERAKELGQFLVLRVDKAPDGTPLTMKKMNEMLQPVFDAEGKGKILYNVDWYPNEEFYYN